MRAAAPLWWPPWLAPWRGLGEPIAATARAGGDLPAALNAFGLAPRCFVPQAKLPEIGQIIDTGNGTHLAFEDALGAEAALATYEPIEYRSQPDEYGDCHFIQWDGIRGGWMVLKDGTSWATEENFDTPEAAATWAKENLK